MFFSSFLIVSVIKSQQVIHCEWKQIIQLFKQEKAIINQKEVLTDFRLHLFQMCFIPLIYCKYKILSGDFSLDLTPTRLF